MQLSIAAEYHDIFQAQLAKGKLLDAGIACFLSSENPAIFKPTFVQSLSAIKLYVLQQDEETARKILA